MPGLSNAQAVSWAHQNGSLQSNGSITIKSQAGGSYGGTVNPAGAVAKANQSAVTQPPTVIIQATSGNYAQAVPMINSGTATIPSCLAGYTSIFSTKSSTYDGYPVFNIGGTRFTFATYYVSGSNWAGFLVDNLPLPTTGTTSTNAWQFGSSPAAGLGAPWGANLCTR